MAVSLADAAVAYGSSKGEVTLTRMFMQLSPFLEELPMKKITGRIFKFARETVLPTAGWRPVNANWTEGSGSIQQQQEELFILGGQVNIDPFIVDTDDGADFENEAVQTKLKAQAISNAFDAAVLEGDDLVDSNSMTGFRRRIQSGQVSVSATTGAPLTLALLDQLIDNVPFPDSQKRLLMNRTNRRKIKTLVDGAGQSVYIPEKRETFGIQPAQYAGIPIRIIERSGDASTIVDFDEDPGDGTSDTSSIYCIAYGFDAVHGIWNGQRPLAMSRHVPDAGTNLYVLRWESYVGLVIRHPRAAARLRGVTNA
jgi:HK97 family phage major capsid protein